MKIIRIILIIIILLAVGIEASILISGKTYLHKTFTLTIFKGRLGPEINDMNFFPKREIKNAVPQPWPVSKFYGTVKLSDALNKKCEDYKTVAFVLIKNDSLLYEKYWDKFGPDSYTNSFSMAKSLNAALIGVALREGKIKSLDEPVGDFIPEFKTGEKAKITIRHLLTMSSGLNFKENYISPLAWPAEAYYGTDVNGLTLKAEPETEPGKTWYYKGGDSQLLGMILKAVTGKNVAEYATEKLWRPMGAEHPAYWSTDTENGMEKVSCCWYSNARDFARLADLYLHYGNWKGMQLIDSSYVIESVTPATLVDRKGKPNQKYGFQWWIVNYKNHYVFYCRGIKGQYIFAIPDLRMIAVRLGHERGKKNGDELSDDGYVFLDAALSLNPVSTGN